MMTSAMILIAALTLDALLGEPKRWHPLVGFGYLATICEKKFYRDNRTAGVVALLVVVTPLVVVAGLLQLTALAPLYTAVLLYIAMGWRSLGQHCLPIAEALTAGRVDNARHQLSRIVSRDTQAIDESGIASATVESVLENGCDAIFGAVFWALIAGAPGVVLYRLVNTLDAMWGYKNARYQQFGWAAARLDDLLNFIPARLTALSYALAGKFSLALSCWAAQGKTWKSPNAGPVMAAGAGSLGVRLGGRARYHGLVQDRPTLGLSKAPTANDIHRSMHLINRAVIIWIAALFATATFINPPA